MIRLECTTGGHNKYYELHLSKSNGRIIVKGLYGAIGQAPKEAMIYDGDNEQAAIAEMQKKQLEKQKKGYIIVSSNDTPVPQPTVKKKTNSGVVIWAMNAQGVKDDDHLESLLEDPEYIAQEKLDGMRAIVHVTPNGLRIFSRNAGVNDPTRPLEKTSALPHLASLRFRDLVGTILDCEILAPGVDSATLSGSIHRKGSGQGTQLVKIYLFDILRYKDENLMDKPLSQRLPWLRILQQQMYSPHIAFLPYKQFSDEKRQLYKDVLARGGEGIMLKRLSAVYCAGGRPANNWYKMKKCMEIDAIIIGFSKGKGKFNQHIGAIVFGQYIQTPTGWQLKQIGKASGMGDAERKKMAEESSSYIGKVVRIKGMERLKSGAIRHPIYIGMRHDKGPEQCRWYEGEQ